MSRPDVVTLGPFVGGMNSLSDATAVADQELVDCVNFEVSVDGSLVQRPPFVTIKDSYFSNTTIIGNALINNVSYIIACNGTNISVSTDGVTWTGAIILVKSKKAIQYRNKIYIIATPDSPGNGGYYDPVANTFTPDASMPRGESGLFAKGRLFVTPGVSATSNGSRLTFTDPIVSDTLSWPGTNFIDISPGDGQNLVDILLYNDNLLLFKQDSTYVLAYDLQISDAILRNINPTIGATTRYSVVLYENSVFVMHEGNVYEIVNYDFQQINIKVPFVLDGTTPSVNEDWADPIFISLVGNRLIVRYYYRIYVFNLRTRTWSRWEGSSYTTHYFGPLVPKQTNPITDPNTQYFGGSCITTANNAYMTITRINDGFDTFTVERDPSTTYTIKSSITTKNYDLNDPLHYKKMLWWGADVLTNRNSIGKATPITVTYETYWSSLQTVTWGSITTATWAKPLITATVVESDVTNDTSISRKFLKFKKVMRFRQINYFVQLESDGTTITGPCRLFTLTAIIGVKEVVTKQVS